MYIDLYGAYTGSWSESLYDAIEDFNQKAQYTHVSARAHKDWVTNFKDQKIHDIALIVFPIVLIVTYFTVFLGNCSPIHYRVVISVMGLTCVALSVLGGRGIGYDFFGMKKDDMQESIPFLMLGIGIDDIFVLFGALDQVSLKLPPAKRI